MRSSACCLARGLVLAAVLVAARGAAQTPRDIDPHVRVAASASPPRLRLAWTAMPGTRGFQVQRREPGERWVTAANALAGDATGFEDADVEPGRVYEYAVRRTPSAAGVVAGNGYVLAGAEVPFRDDPGAVLVLADRATMTALAPRLDRLADDLARDGWEVAREAVEATDAPPAVRARVLAAASARPDRLRAVLLLGAVPRPFSGRINPDGHPDHLGAWPADAYYADLDEAWTDAQDLGGEGAFVNRAGDGRFDPSRVPGELRVAVGRVDMRELPAFGAMDATALLARYLDRDHAFRVGELRVRPRAWVSDTFGYFRGEAFARVAWRDGVAVLGSEPETGRPFFDALDDPDGYALAFGCGAGSPTSAAGVATSADFARRAPRAVFVGLFGSYFGDWSYPDNLLRAALAGPGAVLATTWFARPYAHLHHLGALRSFGEAFLATANNGGQDYDAGSASRSVHQALLGDPTLRLFVVRPPRDLAATAAPGRVALRWSPPPEPVVGYHVYRRAQGATGAGERVTPTPVTATEVTDETVTAGAAYGYRVVAVARVTTGSGTFFNHSQGATVDVTVPAATAADAGAEDAADGGRDVAAAPGGCACGAAARAPGSVGAWLALAAVSAWWRRRRT